MNILITGANGFIGKNLTAELKSRDGYRILEFDLDSPSGALDEYARQCNFVVHLAGVNRPKSDDEFISGNLGFTEILLTALENAGNKAPVLMTSSIQAVLDNRYGDSKRAAEEALFEYGLRNSVPVYVYRLPNVFGKWCRPNYNSVVATFCHSIARDQPVQINDPATVLNMVYIDDVVESIVSRIRQNERTLRLPGEFEHVAPVYSIALGELAELIESFRRSRLTLTLPRLDEPMQKKLYSTYLSYLDEEDFAYPLKMNVDRRGSFTEFLRSDRCGQVSVNISRPGIVKGNHRHNTKCEKFLVVSGRGVVRFRRPDCEEVIEYFVSGEQLRVVDIPVGYTHNIENLGDTDLVTVMWVNEPFDPERPDTYFLEV